MAEKGNRNKKMVGLPTRDSISLMAKDDDLKAKMVSKDGLKKTPIALTEGEFVFSIPAIVALGQGDYQKGIQILEQVHQNLRAQGQMMMDKGLQEYASQRPV